MSGFEIQVTSANGGVAQISGSSYPGYGLSLTQPTSLPAATVTLTAADLAGIVQPGATNIELATVTIRGMGSGSTNVSITVTKLDDDNGLPINPTITVGSVSVSVS